MFFFVQNSKNDYVRNVCDEYLSNEMVSKVVEKECKYDVFIINKLFIVMLMWYGNVNYEDARLKR